MRIVVTGASGFLGSALMRTLSLAGHEIIGVTRKADTPYLRVSSYGDTPAGDVLVHLAQDSDRARVNAGGLANEADMGATIRLLLQKRYVRSVYVSSAVLYGDSHQTPRQTDAPITVNDTYTRIKRDSECAFLDAGGLVARVSNLYGPGMSPGNVISRILGQVPGNGDLWVFDHSPVRDFIWVDDAAAGLAAMLASGGNGILNLGTGVATSIESVAKSALMLAGQAERTVKSSQADGRHSYLVVDPTRTIQLTSWTPVTSLHQGIRNLLKLQSSQRA